MFKAQILNERTSIQGLLSNDKDLLAWFWRYWLLQANFFPYHRVVWATGVRSSARLQSSRSLEVPLETILLSVYENVLRQKVNIKKKESRTKERALGDACIDFILLQVFYTYWTTRSFRLVVYSTWLNTILLLLFVDQRFEQPMLRQTL